MKLSELLFFLVTFFDKREQLIEYHSQYTQNNNAEHDVIQTENLTAVDNEIARPALAARNSPIMTPTRQRPILTFRLLTMSVMLAGRTI